MCRGPTRRRTVRGFQQAGKLWRHHRDRCARAHQGLHHAPPPAAAPHQPTTPLQREADAREIILANLLHLPRTGRSNAHVGMARCVARCVGYRSPRARRGGGSVARTAHTAQTRLHFEAGRTLTPAIVTGAVRSVVQAEAATAQVEFGRGEAS